MEQSLNLSKSGKITLSKALNKDFNDFSVSLFSIGKGYYKGSIYQNTDFSMFKLESDYPSEYEGHLFYSAYGDNVDKVFNRNLALEKVQKLFEDKTKVKTATININELQTDLQKLLLANEARFRVSSKSGSYISENYTFTEFKGYTFKLNSLCSVLQALYNYQNIFGTEVNFSVVKEGEYSCFITESGANVLLLVTKEIELDDTVTTLTFDLDKNSFTSHSGETKYVKEVKTIHSNFFK